ncbi:hypothetical protein GI374_14820 [Paracoccus sp. S-4012]|uniref:hypothetical protein n=1 Tax=Paracoccus sp. S-4012 TaxID=2665648 RepID=UPI0012AF7934|nr:hypothetical protein [Paracoccus sp. S-4012]MRX51683.1 hypothetical protein [Paracoccus sp. S-4012]
MARWLALDRWTLLHSLRMSTAGTLAFASAHAIGLPEAMSAAVTAIVVTQSNALVRQCPRALEVSQTARQDSSRSRAIEIGGPQD